VPVDIADLVHLAHVVVVDSSLDLGLAGKTVRNFGRVSAEELDRNEPAETRIARLPDIAHATTSDEAEELVAVPVSDRWHIERIRERVAARTFERRLRSRFCPVCHAELLGEAVQRVGVEDAEVRQCLDGGGRSTGRRLGSDPVADVGHDGLGVVV